jgi:hypothetical protein
MNNMKGLAKQALSQGSFTIIHKGLMRKIGLYETYLLQYFLDLQDNSFEKAFYQQQERVAEEFGWSVYKVAETIKELQRLELLTIVKKGMPAKNWYLVNETQVLRFLEDLSSLPPVTKESEDLSFEISVSSAMKAKALALLNSQHKEHTNLEQPKRPDEVEQLVSNDIVYSSRSLIQDKMKLFPEKKTIADSVNL